MYKIDACERPDLVQFRDPSHSNIGRGGDSKKLKVGCGLAKGCEIGPRFSLDSIRGEVVITGSNKNGRAPTFRVFADESISRIEAYLIDERAIVEAHA